MRLERGNENIKFKYRPIEGVKNVTAAPDYLVLDGQQRLTSMYRTTCAEEAVLTRTDKGKEIKRFYYLDMKKFAYQKGLVEVINQNRYTYDIVYTSDMRSIPRFNEHNMVISMGRPLVAEDTNVCVVNQLFLDTYGLSVGDKIHVELGDRLFHQGPMMGARARDTENKSNFVSTAELEIIGAYQNMDDHLTRSSERNWSYTSNAIFVPSSLLPVEVPADHEVSVGEFSVLIEDAHDIEQFQEAAEPLAAEMGIPMRFSDGGWLSIKDSFEAGRYTASLTAILTIVGTALALLLAVYLYIGRNKKTYAIMRTLGVPRKKARNSERGRGKGNRRNCNDR